MQPNLYFVPVVTSRCVHLRVAVLYRRVHKGIPNFQSIQLCIDIYNDYYNVVMLFKQNATYYLVCIYARYHSTDKIRDK